MNKLNFYQTFTNLHIDIQDLRPMIADMETLDEDEKKEILAALDEAITKI